MGIEYVNGKNALSDLSLNALTLANRLGEDEVRRFISDNARNIIFFELEDKKHINYLDFDVKIDKFGDCLEIRANNIVTALWFINEWPFEPEHIMKTKKYLTNKGHYKFDGRTKKLTFHEATT